MSGAVPWGAGGDEQRRKKRQFIELGEGERLKEDKALTEWGGGGGSCHWSEAAWMILR